MWSHFDENTRYLVEKRLARRIREAEIGSFASYFYQLRNGSNAEEEFSAIVDVLTTNETYFFREQSQLTALVEEIIPETLSRQATGPRGPSRSGRRAVRVARTLFDRDVGIGSRLDSGSRFSGLCVGYLEGGVSRARRGIYREASFRETKETIRQRYLRRRMASRESRTALSVTLIRAHEPA